MSRKLIMKVCMLAIFGTAVYSLVSHAIWLYDYTMETGFSIWDEMIPFLFNLFYFLPAIVLYLLIKANYSFQDIIFWLGLASTIFLIAGLINAATADDPLPAGIPIIVFVVPLLLIFSFMGYVKWRDIKKGN